MPTKALLVCTDMRWFLVYPVLLVCDAKWQCLMYILVYNGSTAIGMTQAAQHFSRAPLNPPRMWAAHYLVQTISPPRPP